MTLSLHEQFLELKEMEAQVKQKRYEVEAKIAIHYGYDALSGRSQKIKDNDFEIQFSASQVKKVDYVKLREIQAQFNIPQADIEKLFRHKLEVNSAEFNALPQEQKDILNSAIAIQINKPTLKIIKKD